MTTPAATRRTTAKKKVAANDFDAKRKKIVRERKASSVYEWTVYDRLWHLKRPNVVLVGAQEDEETLGSFVVTLLAHIVKDERKDFTAALQADEDLDFDVLAAMVADMQSVVYAELAAEA